MILVGGENLIDFIEEPSDDGLPPLYRAWPGGGPFNAAKALALQDIPTGYLTPVSTDPLGRLLAADLDRLPALSRLAPDSARPTTLAVVSLDEGQARYQFYREGTAERDVTAQGLIDLVPDEVEAFFVGTLAIADGADADAWAALWGESRARGLFTALDPNIRAAFIHDRPAFEARLDTMLASADLVKLSDEDLAWLTPGEDSKIAVRALARRTSAPLTVLTQGSAGVFAVFEDAEISVPVHPVRTLVDTVGAGDTFMATLLAEIRRRGLLGQGQLVGIGATDVKGILEVAARAAAINCERRGCQPPTLTDLFERS